MKVSEGKIVTFTHRVLNQQHSEIVFYKRKILFIPGCVNEKLYNAMLNKEKGSKLTLSFTRSEIGEHDLSKVVHTSRENIKTKQQLKKGMLLKTYFQDNLILGHIVKVEDQNIQIDLNPHLNILKQDVIFEIEIFDIQHPVESTESHCHRQTLDMILSKNQTVRLIDNLL